MTRVRFNTDRALFDAFPSARDFVKTEPLGVPPQVFLRTLMGDRKFDEALSFCAYLLPRREAVAWGCRCLRHLSHSPAEAVVPSSLKAAEAWVEEPSEEARLAAHQQWTAGDKNDPTVWLALAAAWSGGSLTPDQVHSLPAQPHLTASMVRVALLLGVHRLKVPEKTVYVEAWIADGSRIAEAGL